MTPKMSTWPSVLTLLRILVDAMLVILAVQFVSGVLVSVYLNPPYSSSVLVFNLHYTLGLFVVAVGLSVIAISVLTREVSAVVASAVGFFSVVAAYLAGRDFAFSGQNPLNSVIMGIGFLVAYSAYYSEESTVRRIRAAARLSAANK
jgi:hypothetical protein